MPETSDNSLINRFTIEITQKHTKFIHSWIANSLFMHFVFYYGRRISLCELRFIIVRLEKYRGKCASRQPTGWRCNEILWNCQLFLQKEISSKFLNCFIIINKFAKAISQSTMESHRFSNAHHLPCHWNLFGRLSWAVEYQ